MRINDIQISKRYGQDGYECRVTIDGDYQQLRLILDDAHTQKVIDVVGDLIVAASRQVAENLTKQALDHKALEHKAV